jgi:hypothetical protein
MVAIAIKMFINQPPEELLLEVATIYIPSAEDYLAHIILEINAEPTSQWYAESVFLASCNLRRDRPLHGLIENVF